MISRLPALLLAAALLPQIAVAAEAGAVRPDWLPPDEAILQVATSFYCRAKWTEAKRFGRAFDINDCMGSDLLLAQPLD